jgi:hypothetical protein
METHSRRSNKTSGPIPVLGGDMTVEDWKRTLSKMTAGAAAETVIANYIYDPVCDYGTSVRILRRVLQAWAEIELDANGIGLGGRGDKPPII